MKLFFNESNMFYIRLTSCLLIHDAFYFRMLGLLDAFEHLLPLHEHRYCLKYLHANVKSCGLKGQAIKEVLFACVKSCTEEEFLYNIEEMRKLCLDAHHYLKKLEPCCWSKHAFRTHCKSDMLLNKAARRSTLGLQRRGKSPF